MSDAEDGRMPLGNGQAVMCEVSADQQAVRMHLPPLHLATVRRPINICLDMDAEAVDALLQQLGEARMQMLPPPKRN